MNEKSTERKNVRLASGCVRFAIIIKNVSEVAHRLSTRKKVGTSDMPRNIYF